MEDTKKKKRIILSSVNLIEWGIKSPIKYYSSWSAITTDIGLCAILLLYLIKPEMWR